MPFPTLTAVNATAPHLPRDVAGIWAGQQQHGARCLLWRPHPTQRNHLLQGSRNAIGLRGGGGGE